MNELKLTIAKNIAELRKQHDMTQIQLAERLNYSDKAVSKWERGESVPDIYVLIEIAKLFSVSLDYLVSEEHSANEDVSIKDQTLSNDSVARKRRAIICIAVEAVCLVAAIIFVILALCVPESNAKWLSFVYSVPVSAIIWLVFNSVWFNRRKNYFIISVLMWSVIAAFHITMLAFGKHWYLIYLLGIPGELIIMLWSVITKKPTKQ